MFVNADPTFPYYTPLPSAPERPTYGYRPRALNAPPAVSIVTPFYDTGEIFRQTAESVFRQTMQQWEWIIVNDASTDDEALQVLAEYREADPRIRVIDHAVNRGVGAARNSGFEAARTDYVVQLDSDDLLEPTMVEKLYWCLQSYPAYSFAKGYTAGFGVESYLWINGFHFREAFLETNHADALAMIKRSAARAVGGY
ncbi:MAG: glycosyltransferase family 2 protein, partial [bacterium]|nr:glycosyltransferase family 2 protein [bacterium]